MWGRSNFGLWNRDIGRFGKRGSKIAGNDLSRDPQAGSYLTGALALVLQLVYMSCEGEFDRVGRMGFGYWRRIVLGWWDCRRSDCVRG
jgi:hypothetical protein